MGSLASFCSVRLKAILRMRCACFRNGLLWGAALLLMYGCGSTITPVALAIRPLPSDPDSGVRALSRPHVDSVHVMLSYLRDPNTGLTDPILVLPKTHEAKWVADYLEQDAKTTETKQGYIMPVPVSINRIALGRNLKNLEMWLGHAEAVALRNLVDAGKPGSKFRYSPWVEKFGMPAWKTGLSVAEPLQEPRWNLENGSFRTTGTPLDLAVINPQGKVAYFGVINEKGALVGLTRDGRLYRTANGSLASRHGPLHGLEAIQLPDAIQKVSVDETGRVQFTSMDNGALRTAAFGPVHVYLLPLHDALQLQCRQGLWTWSDTVLLPQPVPSDAAKGILLSGKIELPPLNEYEQLKQLQSIRESRTLVARILDRLNQTILVEQTFTFTPPVRVELKSDVRPFEEILKRFAEQQSGGKVRPPLKLLHKNKMRYTLKFLNFRAPNTVETKDAYVYFPMDNPQQTAKLLGECAEFLRFSMEMHADNVQRMYQVVDTILVGADRKPRMDLAPRQVVLNPDTKIVEARPREKPFRKRLIPGHKFAIDANGTVYVPNLNQASEVNEYRLLQSEYDLVEKALRVVSPEVILDDPPKLVIPDAPAAWGN